MYLGTYKCQTTFWEDFSIADRFGVAAIKETAIHAMTEWAEDIVYMTELVMVLNHKIWQHYERNPRIAQEYNTLWQTAEDRVFATFTGDDLAYYIETTD